MFNDKYCFVLIFMNLSISALAESVPDPATVSTSPPEETNNTGNMLNIIAFLLLAASAVAMIFVLFPKERQF
jgi:hypothetical protein